MERESWRFEVSPAYQYQIFLLKANHSCDTKINVLLAELTCGGVHSPGDACVQLGLFMCVAALR